MSKDLTEIFSFEIFRQIQGALPDEEVARLKSLVVLLQTAANIKEEMRMRFASFGVSQSKYYILILLHEKSGEFSTPSQIADFAGISRATVSGLLDGLEHDGLIERHADKEDRRMMRLNITEKGKRVLQEILPYDCKITLGLMSCLSNEEVCSLTSIIDKLNNRLSELKGTIKEK